MSEAQTPASGDPYATGKANLRDTIKWLAGILSALAAAILATTPLTGISSLHGLRFGFALAAFTVGFLSILAAIGVLLWLLTGETFSLARLQSDKNLKTWFNDHADDTLPPEVGSVEALAALRTKTIADIRTWQSQPASEQYATARRNYAVVDAGTSRIVNLALYESLRRSTRDRLWPLCGLAIAVVVSLGAFAIIAGPAKTPTTVCFQGVSPPLATPPRP